MLCTVRVEHVRTALDRDKGTGLLEVHPNLVVIDLRIVDVHECLLRLEVLDKGDSSRFAGVTSVRLESEAKDCDTLRGQTNN